MSVVLQPVPILLYVLGVAALFFVGKLLTAPLKWLLRLLLNSVLGAAAIVIINLIGGAFSFYIPLNPLNAALTGIFGLPGVLLIIVIRLICA